MILKVQAVLARHRRAVLGAAAVPIVFALVARWAGADPDVVMPVLFLPLLFWVALMVAIMWAPSVRNRPPAFEGSRTRESGDLVATGAAALALVAFLAPVPGEIFDEDVVRYTAALLFPLVVAGQLPSMWRGVGVTLTPEGVHARLRWGSMSFPWEALAAEQPEHDGGPVRLAFARPELVRTTGFVPRRVLLTEGGDEELVAAAIRRHRESSAAVDRVERLDS